MSLVILFRLLLSHQDALTVNIHKVSKSFHVDCCTDWNFMNSMNPNTGINSNFTDCLIWAQILFHFLSEIKTTQCLMSIVEEFIGRKTVQRLWPMSQQCHLSQHCTAKLCPQWLSSVHSVPEMSTYSRLLTCSWRDLYSSISPSLCSCKSSSISATLILIQM